MEAGEKTSGTTAVPELGFRPRVRDSGAHAEDEDRRAQEPPVRAEVEWPRARWRGGASVEWRRWRRRVGGGAARAVEAGVQGRRAERRRRRRRGGVQGRSGGGVEAMQIEVEGEKEEGAGAAFYTGNTLFPAQSPARE
jgi:hypothetical protein